jgi:radical SAM protein with 4Fe4S-binding SPASM domain
LEYSIEKSLRLVLIPLVSKYVTPIQEKAVRYRFENFGGIIATEEPPLLAFVDRLFMRELGLGESNLWEDPDETIGLLSAPTEVHLAATNACPVGCRHCYMGAGQSDPGEMNTATLKGALKELAEMGVFHIALGGGETLIRSDLFEIAGYARTLGMVPNLTVSGAQMTPETARRMKIFGQVNVSFDGVGALYGVFRGHDMFKVADRAVDMLLAAGVPTGINCVVGRKNYDGIPELFEFAKKKGVNEIEFLRLKPSGRGGHSYMHDRTTHEQNIDLTPMLAHLSERHGLCAKIDCSFIPMLCHHNPPREMLQALATYGCEAGNVLLGIRSDGTATGCSFLQGEGPHVFGLHDAWNGDTHFQRLRTWTAQAPEPCCSCEYLDICKGGCHAVAAYVSGDFNAPDPSCPRVVCYNDQGG